MRAAKELEFLTDEQIDHKARQYGLVEQIRAEKIADELGGQQGPLEEDVVR